MTDEEVAVLQRNDAKRARVREGVRIHADVRAAPERENELREVTEEELLGRRKRRVEEAVALAERLAAKLLQKVLAEADGDVAAASRGRSSQTRLKKQG